MNSASLLPKSLTRGFGLLTCLVLASTLTARAAVTKADNTNALGSAASWVGGVAPGAADIAAWSGTYSADNTTNSLKAVMSGTALSWQGLSVGALSGTALTTNTIYAGVTGGVGAQTNLSAASQSGTLVTITTRANHGFAPGQSVKIAGVTPAGYNGTFTVVGVPSATTFTFNTTAGLTAGTAFGTVESAIYVGGAGTAIVNSSLTIGSAGIDLSTASHSAALVATGFAFNGSQTWTVPAGRNLRFGGGGVSAASAKVVTSGNDGLIDISGGGVVDVNQGGSTGMADAAGFTGFTGKWRVNSGTTLRGLRQGATAWGSNPGADSITLNGGTLSVGGISGAVGNWTWTNAITLATGTTSAIDEQNVTGTGRSLKLNGNFSGSGNLVIKDTGPAGAFTNPDLGFVLTGANAISGTVTIAGPTENGIAGRLSYVRVGGVGGDSTSLNAGTSGDLGSASIVNNGVLTFSRSDGITISNSISGTGSVRIGGNVGLVQTEIVMFEGAKTYSGDTLIGLGSLVLGASASIPNTARIIISNNSYLDVLAPASGLALNNGQTLIGMGGTIYGNVSAGAGTVFVPGGSNVVGTLPISGNLTLSGGGTLVLDVTASANDQITVQELKPSGVTTLLIVPPAGGLFAGSYSLITASTALNGGTNNFALAGLSSAGRGQTFTLAYDTSTPGALALKLIVTGSPATLVWRGDGKTNTWDTLTTTNWVNAGIPDAFVNDDFVTFDDTGSNSPAINLTGSLKAGSVTVAAAQNYTFAGSGKLTGGGALTNSGPGTLTLVTSNDFTGKTVITGGAIAITNEAALGSNPTVFTADQLVLDAGALSIGAPLTLRSTNRGITLGTSGGTLAHGTFAVTVSNIVTGAGGLTKTGSGTLTMSGSNSYTGGTIITDGQVNYGHGAGLGRGGSTSGTSGYFAKPFTLQKGIVDLNGKTTYDPNFSGGSAAIGVPVMLYDGPVVFAGSASSTMIFQDTSGAVTNGWGNGNAAANTITYDAALNPATATISARFAASGSSGATTRNFEIGDSAATGVEVDITGALGVISVNSTNQDGRNTTLAKSGEGLLRISAPNNFPMWQVNAGTLRVNHAQALGADRTLSVGVTGGTGSPNLLILMSGGVDLNGFSPAIGGLLDAGSPFGVITNGSASACTLTIGGANTNLFYGGVIADGARAISLVKVGTNSQTLSGVNTYSGSTTVSNGALLVDGEIRGSAVTAVGGVLGGAGVIRPAVSVQSGGGLSPGNGLGTLSISNALTLAAGSTTFIDVDATSNTSDLVQGLTSVTFGGRLVVTNQSGTLVDGQTFQIFSRSGTGDFTSLTPPPGPGLVWKFTPATGALSVVPMATNPTKLTSAVVGTNLVLAWPSDHTGWLLQAQTNSLNVGLSTNWYPVADSTNVNAVSLPIDASQGAVFYRLALP